VLAEYLPFCEVALSTHAAPLPPVRDAADSKFLQLAVTAAVPFLVTGDAGLLSLAGAALPAPVAVVTPEQLRQLFAESA